MGNSESFLYPEYQNDSEWESAAIKSEVLWRLEHATSRLEVRCANHHAVKALVEVGGETRSLQADFQPCRTIIYRVTEEKAFFGLVSLKIQIFF